jgi:hypothetical protein
MIPAVGATVLVACEQMNIACAVRDVKMSYGRPRFLVRPLAGNGEQWVELQRISVTETRAANIASALAEARPDAA